MRVSLDGSFERVVVVPHLLQTFPGRFLSSRPLGGRGVGGSWRGRGVGWSWHGSGTGLRVLLAEYFPSGRITFFTCLISGLLIFAGLITASSDDGDGLDSALFLGVIHVGLGVESGDLGVSLGVIDALASTVAFITGIGSDVHDLMEHSPSE